MNLNNIHKTIKSENVQFGQLISLMQTYIHFNANTKNSANCRNVDDGSRIIGLSFVPRLVMSRLLPLLKRETSELAEKQMPYLPVFHEFSPANGLALGETREQSGQNTLKPHEQPIGPSI